MVNPFQFTMTDLQLFTLAWFRITGLMFISPIFGSNTVPPRLKILLSLVVSLIFFSFIPREGVTVEPNFLLYIVWVLLELAIGMILGFAATLIFAATTYDSASYTLAAAATRRLPIGDDPPRWHRLFWAIALTLLPLTLMFVGGLRVMQTAVLVVSLPILVVGVCMSVALVKQLATDTSG